MSSIDVKRRKGESFEGLMRRFTRRVSSSGKLLQARKIRFYKAEPNKNKLRDSALRRQKMRERREWMIKVGKLVEENFGRGRGSRR